MISKKLGIMNTGSPGIMKKVYNSTTTDDVETAKPIIDK